MSSWDAEYRIDPFHPDDEAGEYDIAARADEDAELLDVLADALFDEQSEATPALDDALFGVLETMSPAEEVNFTSVLRALPAVAQVGGTLVGGPAVGGVVGGAVSRALPRSPATAPPPPATALAGPLGSPVTPAVPVPEPSLAAARAMVMLGREDQKMQKSLAKLALAQSGPVGDVSVGALVNVLGALLQQAAVDADRSLALSSAAARLAASDSEMYADPSSAEHRAERLYDELVAAEDAYLIERGGAA